MKTPTGTTIMTDPGRAAPPRTILIVEDNETLALGLRTSFEVEGYTVHCVYDGRSGLEWLHAREPDLIILDLMLPKLSGFELLRRFRADGGGAAVLILSARDQEVDKVQGFRLGADDYVVKPVGVLELLARADAMMRRLSRPTSHAAAPAGPERRYEFGDVVLDLRTRGVVRSGQPVELTPMEFDLLAFLIQSGGEIVTREQLTREVWGYAAGLPSRTVDQHVARLRHKLERDPTAPLHIITVRKVGYRFAS